MSEQVKERVGEGAQQVQEKASEAKDRTRAKVSEQLNTRSTQTGEQMTKTADALRQTAQQLRGQQQAQPAQVLEGVAQRVERFGQYLTANDGDRFLRDVERIARKQPWLVVTGGAVLGLVAARFTKASSTRRYEPNGSGLQRPALPAQTGGGTREYA
jgi:broad specificity phosphatase PhoE